MQLIKFNEINQIKVGGSLAWNSDSNHHSPAASENNQKYI